jgi:hypothetical protein
MRIIFNLSPTQGESEVAYGNMLIRAWSGLRPGKIKKRTCLSGGGWSRHNDRGCEGRNGMWKRFSEWGIMDHLPIRVSTSMVCVMGWSVTGDVGAGTGYRNEFQTKNYFTLSQVALYPRIRILFGNSNKGGFDPSLSHSTTDKAYMRVFCRPRSRFQLRFYVISLTPTDTSWGEKIWAPRSRLCPN